MTIFRHDASRKASVAMPTPLPQSLQGGVSFGNDLTPPPRATLSLLSGIDERVFSYPLLLPAPPTRTRDPPPSTLRTDLFFSRFPVFFCLARPFSRLFLIAP